MFWKSPPKALLSRSLIEAGAVVDDGEADEAMLIFGCRCCYLICRNSIKILKLRKKQNKRVKAKRRINDILII